jgi:ABC-type branched-subunit amino acid transport system permease subunit
MQWDLIFSNALYAAIAVNAIGYCLIAVGLNVHFGYTGLLNFGQAGFAAIGAYAVAVPIARYGWSLWAAIPIIFVGGLVLGLILGVPTLRLRADYLAIVTIATAEIIRLVVGSERFRWLFGGQDGLQGYTQQLQDLNPFSERVTVWAQIIGPYDLFVIIIGWVIVALTSLLVWSLMRSPWGRVLKSIREDEDAARSLGKNVFSYKMQSLVVGGIIGALGGTVIAVGNRAAQPGNYSTTLTFFAFTILILGGVARVKGPIVGAIIFWFTITLVDNILAEAVRADAIPSWLGWLNITNANFGQVKYIIAGAALAVLVVFRPQGIFGDRREQAFDVR